MAIPAALDRATDPGPAATPDPRQTVPRPAGPRRRRFLATLYDLAESRCILYATDPATGAWRSTEITGVGDETYTTVVELLAHKWSGRYVGMVGRYPADVARLVRMYPPSATEIA